MGGLPRLAGLGGNGQLDSSVAAEGLGLFAVRPDGSTMWQRHLPSGHSTPGVGDLDGDGHVDVVVANDEGTVYALDGRNGNTKWGVGTSQFT